MIYIYKYIRKKVANNSRYAQFPILNEYKDLWGEGETERFLILTYESTKFKDLNGNKCDNCYKLIDYPKTNDIKVDNNFYSFTQKLDDPNFESEIYYRKD